MWRMSWWVAGGWEDVAWLLHLQLFARGQVFAGGQEAKVWVGDCNMVLFLPISRGCSCDACYDRGRTTVFLLILPLNLGG